MIHTQNHEPQYFKEIVMDELELTSFKMLNLLINYEKSSPSLFTNKNKNYKN